MAVDASISREEAGTVAIVRIGIRVYLALLLSALVLLYVYYGDQLLRVIDEIWFVGGVGVFGAIIANATGTGGGVVFIPVFIAIDGLARIGQLSRELQLVPQNAFAISFLIQCFGMSVGSLVWLHRFYGGGKVHPADKIDGHSFITIVFSTVVTTIPALLITQNALIGAIDGKLLLDLFKWFSVVLGVVLLVFTWALKRVKPYRYEPAFTDIYMLLLLGAVGGVITAFFSVGVGELVAVYLIFRKFPTVAAVAAAVVISAFAVVAGVWANAGSIIWPIALMAAPGAMVGGFVARLFALWLGPLWLKTFASLWITCSSLYLIFGPQLGVMPDDPTRPPARTQQQQLQRQPQQQQQLQQRQPQQQQLQRQPQRQQLQQRQPQRQPQQPQQRRPGNRLPGGTGR